MASITYSKARRQWEVRRHITDQSGRIKRLFKRLPRGSTKLDAEYVAKTFDQKAREIKTGKYRLPENIDTAVDKWLLHNRRHADSTQKYYESVIKRFISALPKISRVDQITPMNVHDYINLRITKVKNRTCNAELTAIKSFCRWVGEVYKITNPAAAVKMLTEDPPNQRFLTAEEYGKIIAAGDRSFFHRFAFLANTGLRATEIGSIAWNNISEDGGSLTVVGKGRKRRTIPLNSTCRKILAELKTPNTNLNNPIFLSKSNKKSLHNTPVTRQALYQECKRLADRIKVPVFGPHSFRHYFATSLLLNGVPVSHVSKLLGHGSIKTTEQIYIHILPDDLAGITDCLSGS